MTGEGYRNCTNAIYEPLYGGTASVVREKKGLIKGQSVRDNMSRVELAAVGLAEALASDEIDKKIYEVMVSVKLLAEGHHALLQML